MMRLLRQRKGNVWLRFSIVTRKEGFWGGAEGEIDEGFEGGVEEGEGGGQG